MVTLNPTATVDVDDTLTGTTSTLTHINLIQPTVFTSIIYRKIFPNLECFCQCVPNLALDIQASDIPISRLGNIAMVGAKFTFIGV